MMQDAGIEVIQALEVKMWRIFLRRLDLRQHRKIIVIDDEIAYTGSMNLVDPAYFKQNSGVGHWVDIMVRIAGPTVNVLSAITVGIGKSKLANVIYRDYLNARSMRVNSNTLFRLCLLAQVCRNI